MESIDPIQLLLAGIADYAVFLLDNGGHVIRWSSSAEKMFGYAKDEMQGRHLSYLYASEKDGDSRAVEEIEMAAAHGRFEDIAWRIKRDGSQFWADSVLCPLRSEAGELQGFSLIIRDITERKKAEEALQRKEEELTEARKMEAIGRLAGSIAHDFNNFITGIVGLAEEIRLSMSEQDPRRMDLEEIIKTSDQARLLTRGLLAFGRRQLAAPQVIQLNTVLSEKKKIFTRLLRANVKLETHLDPKVRHILIDPTQLDQLLINLLINASDSMPQGGVVRIETHLAEKNMLLVISDTGCGMEERVLEHLFEPFFTTKEQGKGTGLGLATVYGIVKQNHGDISVKSRPGEGTTFTIQFPEIDGPVEIQSEIVSKPAKKTGSETILVVEDTPIVQRVVIQTLKKGGYKILAASSGPEALQLAQEHSEPIDLILTDLMMPGMNGCELAELLQKSHPEASVLYMSGYAEDLPQEKGLLREGVFFLEKPFTNALLTKKVREVLENRRTAGARNKR